MAMTMTRSPDASATLCQTEYRGRHTATEFKTGETTCIIVFHKRKMMHHTHKYDSSCSNACVWQFNPNMIIEKVACNTIMTNTRKGL